MEASATPILKNGSGRLTPAGGKRALELRRTGATYQMIAAELQVSVGTIRNVVKSASWAWLRTAVEAGQI